MALIRNVSTRGTLLLTQVKLQIGERITMQMYLSPEPTGQSHETLGRVVRAERRELERPDLWPFLAAVEFDEPLDDLRKLIEDLAERQRELGLPMS